MENFVYLWNSYYSKYYTEWRIWEDEPQIYVEFRKDPIPRLWDWTHDSRKCIFRKIKTQQERKMWYAHLEDEKEYGHKLARQRRSANALPDSWEEFIKEKMRIRSWKRTKKRKQWM